MKKLLMVLGLFLILHSNTLGKSHYNENLDVIEIAFSKYDNSFKFIDKINADFLIRERD